MPNTSNPHVHFAERNSWSEKEHVRAFRHVACVGHSLVPSNCKLSWGLESSWSPSVLTPVKHLLTRSPCSRSRNGPVSKSPHHQSGRRVLGVCHACQEGLEAVKGPKAGKWLELVAMQRKTI